MRNGCGRMVRSRNMETELATKQTQKEKCSNPFHSIIETKQDGSNENTRDFQRKENVRMDASIPSFFLFIGIFVHQSLE